MGRKNAAAQKTPVDNCRKQLGKYESRKLKERKKDANRLKHRKVEEQSSIGYGFLIFFALSLLIVAVNVPIYLGLKYESKRVEILILWLHQLFQTYLKPRLPWTG